MASLLYDADDRMVSAETYDSNGNTLTTGGKNFAYDSGNRLTATNGDVTLVYEGRTGILLRAHGGEWRTPYIAPSFGLPAPWHTGTCNLGWRT
jgi:hypothetical protein